MRLGTPPPSAGTDERPEPELVDSKDEHDAVCRSTAAALTAAAYDVEAWPLRDESDDDEVGVEGAGEEEEEEGATEEVATAAVAPPKPKPPKPKAATAPAPMAGSGHANEQRVSDDDDDFDDDLDFEDSELDGEDRNRDVGGDTCRGIPGDRSYRKIKVTKGIDPATGQRSLCFNSIEDAEAYVR